MEAAVSEAHDLTVGVSNEGEQLQLLRAMCQQLSAQPELALDMDFGAFVFQHLGKALLFRKSLLRVCRR